jgi:hypothetical protein
MLRVFEAKSVGDLADRFAVSVKMVQASVIRILFIKVGDRIFVPLNKTANGKSKIK